MISDTLDGMKRPVWLFSLDTEQFTFLPLVTAGLKAWFVRYGMTAADTAIDIVHFRYHADAHRWIESTWPHELKRMRYCLSSGRRPVAAFSCYTWNVPTFLTMIAEMKRACPELLVIVGGPHVQEPEVRLFHLGVDVVVIGEGELTLTDLLDAHEPYSLRNIEGIVYRDDSGELIRTRPRARLENLDRIPSAIPHLSFSDQEGRPYRWAAYETMRGCPYACSYCQWGTGAIGVRVSRYSIDRVRSDLTALMEGGVEGLLFCDANYGALPEDREKAEVLVELSERCGRPTHFATCWAKKHSKRVQDVAALLHRHGLLEHYSMALQTLTPAALSLSNRVNMKDYESAARSMRARGIPVVSELIWGLPGETLADFERNLDKLTTIFPSHTIYPYALLPGTDLFNRRHALGIETVELAPYGEARADYIIASNSFSREEGLEGYALITAFILLYRGNFIPLTTRYMAIGGEVSASAILLSVIHRLIEHFRHHFPALAEADMSEVFEKREFLYRWLLQKGNEAFSLIADTILGELRARGQSQLIPNIERVLRLDCALRPVSRTVEERRTNVEFDFDALGAYEALESMELPSPDILATGHRRRVSLITGWDFGDEVVPRALPVPAGWLRSRYPVWP
jgi:tRNA A37 methylthiotransferase MiaB